MKIIVTGAQIPFARGGAELLMENLVAALRQAGHDAELVRQPSAWDRVRIFDAALAWRLAPIDADLVIATNFPSYFVRHDNKVVWLCHQHRGAYDGEGTAWSDFDGSPKATEAKRRLVEWDQVAFNESKRVFTISQVVTERLRSFNGLPSTPLYHPPPLAEQLHAGEYGPYVFSAMRLEANKRPGPLVDSIASTAALGSLRLAGVGSQHDSLLTAARAQNIADRVHLLGFVSDEDLVDEFANCSAVLYAPFDEDYGYVTLQAFLARKPVITSHDAGGVLEWVEDGVTGFVTDGSPEALGEASTRLLKDPTLARRMGEAGYERARSLRWSDVVETLVSGRHG